MRFKAFAAISAVALAGACAQQEEPPTEVYVPVQFDKYGDVVGGTIVDGYMVADDGTVIGPVSPGVDPDGPDGPGNQNRNRNQAEVQSQVTTNTQTRTGRP